MRRDNHNISLKRVIDIFKDNPDKEFVLRDIKNETMIRTEIVESHLNILLYIDYITKIRHQDYTYKYKLNTTNECIEIDKTNEVNTINTKED